MAAWYSGQVITESLGNQKFILIQDAAPSTAYEGQTWSCTSSNPLLVKSYDFTNTQWMEHHPRKYEEVSALKTQPHTDTPILNGSLFFLYSTSGASTRLFMRGNNRFWGLEG